MKVLSLILVSFGLSHVLWAKPTRGGGHSGVQIEIETLEAPDTRVEPAIVLAPRVQECLRQIVRENGVLDVEVTGLVSRKGTLMAVQVKHPAESVRVCVKTAVEHIGAGKGASGPLKVRIARAQGGNPKAKTFVLELKTPKKFQ